MPNTINPITGKPYSDVQQGIIDKQKVQLAPIPPKISAPRNTPISSSPAAPVVAPTPPSSADVLAAEQARLAAERNAQIGVADDDQARISGIGKDFGLDDVPTTITDIVSEFKRNQMAEKSALQKQQDAQRQLDQNASERFEANAKGTKAAVRTTFAQDREGPMSGSAPKVVSEFTAAMNKNLQDNKIRVDAAQAARDSIMVSLDAAQKQGNTEMARNLERTLAAAQVKIDDAKARMMEALSAANRQTFDTIKSLQDTGILENATPDQIDELADSHGISRTELRAAARASTLAYQSNAQKEKAAQMSNAIDTFMKLNTGGVPITSEMIMETSSATGVRPAYLEAAAAGYNKTVQAIQNSKNLDPEIKATALAQAKQDLSDQVNGYATEAAKGMRDLAMAYKRGESPEMIAALKHALGDPSDPMEKAKLQYLYAQTDNERINAYTAALDAGLNPGALVPTNGKYGVSLDQNGNYQIEPPDGSYGGQCGRYVNQAFGAQIMGDDYERDKLAKCDPNIGFGTGQSPPVPGMAFVMPVAGSSNGHTGIFLGVDPQNSNNALVKDSNWPYKDENGKVLGERVQTHSIPLSSITGYAVPPNAQAVSSTVANMSNEQILAAYEAAGKVFDDPAAARKAITAARQNNFVPGATSGGTDPAKIARDIINPLSGAKLSDISIKMRPLVSAELTKLREEAFQAGDVYGVVRASAGGTQMSDTQEQKLVQAQNVLTELGDLQSVFKNANTGPIISILRSNNPYDSKAREIKARLQALVPSLARGIYGEVGVLTNTDIENYIQTLPNLSSTESQKKLLMDMTKKIVVSSVENTLKTAARNGKDVSGFTSLLEDSGIQEKKPITRADIKSPMLQNFLDDPNASEQEKLALLNDLNKYPESAGENALRRLYGAKYVIRTPSPSEFQGNYSQYVNSLSSSYADY